MLEITDSSDIGMLDSIWSKTPAAAQAHLNRFQFPELPGEYASLAIASTATGGIGDDAEYEVEEEDEHTAGEECEVEDAETEGQSGPQDLDWTK